MYGKLKYFFFILTAFLQISAIAQQSKADSLAALLKKEPIDTLRAIHMNLLARELININFDTALFLSEQALKISEKQKWEKGIAQSHHQVGMLNYLKGNYVVSLEHYKSALIYWDLLKDKKGKSKTLGNMGLIFFQQGDYPTALDYFLKSLKLDEELNFDSGIAKNYANLGLVYMDQNSFQKALEYNLKAVKINQKLDDKLNLATAYGNIAGIYFKQMNYPKALEYNLLYLKTAEESGNRYSQAVALSDIGHIYNQQIDKTKAFECYSNALEICTELGYKKGIAHNTGNIGFVYFRLKKYETAERYMSKAVELYKEVGVIADEKIYHECLSDIYAKTGRDELALIEYKIAMALKDSLFSEAKNSEITRKEMTYEFEKKENQAKAEQEKKEAITLAEKKQQNIFFWLVTSIAAAIGIITLVILRSLTFTKKQKVIIELQKNMVEEKQKEILDSIHYAKRIQRSLLPTETYIGKNLNRLKK